MRTGSIKRRISVVEKKKFADERNAAAQRLRSTRRSEKMIDAQIDLIAGRKTSKFKGKSIAAQIFFDQIGELETAIKTSGFSTAKKKDKMQKLTDAVNKVRES